MMKQVHLEHSPIVYHISRANSETWLLFLHAAFVDHNMFQQQFHYFQGRYNLIAVDILGHGKSTETRKGDSLLQMSRWLKELLLQEGISKVNLIGISLGAVLVQDFANQFPELVQSLTCFGGYDINNFDVRLQQKNGLAQMGIMLKGICSVSWFAKANKKISAYTKEAQEAFYEMNLQFPKKSFQYLAALNQMVNVHAPQPRTYPLLIGCGEQDIPMELEALRMWKESEPECRMIILPGAGHCANMDAPLAFNQILEDFLIRQAGVPKSDKDRIETEED